MWQPSPARCSDATLTRYLRWLDSFGIASPSNYDELWDWSVVDLAAFWDSIARFFDVHLHSPYSQVLSHDEMPGAQWFPGASLNYAEQALRHDLATPAVLAYSEAGEPVELSWDQLRGQVGALARWLTEHGVHAGDRVVGYLPNIPAAVVSFLACASVGAVWSACSPEYSAHGAAERFAQLEPVVLIAADGYRYGGKAHTRGEQVAELLALLPTVRDTLWVDNLAAADAEELSVNRPERWASFTDIIAGPTELTATPLPFEHPLWVLYSSGTTGRPKGIVHGHGGILLEHLKFLGLHLDVQAGDRFSWYTSTSWMMWNVQVAGLLHGATIVLYDGSPVWPDAAALWRLAATAKLDFLGTSPAYLTGSQKAGLAPAADYDLSHLRTLGSTGSPLPASAYEWVHRALPDVWLDPASGGTDIASGFVGGVPTLPVRVGEMQARMLGVSAESWDAVGRPVRDSVGELVVTRPMPSMPLYFWDDPDASKYRAAYFDTYPGIWRHGDWATITSGGAVMVHGRSDATMNRLGIRMGSAEIYDAVEQLDQITESLVLGIELDNGGYWMPLFVTTPDGIPATPELIQLVLSTIRTTVSPRHVPDEVIWVKALPHTLTGKRLEVPIKRILQGLDPAKAANPRAVDNPEALAWFADLAVARKAAARQAT